MDDPRLVDWLKLTRQALEASKEELAQTLQQLSAGRAELQRSLEESPPSSAPGEQLTRELEQTEAELERLVTGMREQLEARLAELRKLQSGTAGYRPARSNTPAFVSKSV